MYSTFGTNNEKFARTMLVQLPDPAPWDNIDSDKWKVTGCIPVKREPQSTWAEQDGLSTVTAWYLPEMIDDVGAIPPEAIEWPKWILLVWQRQAGRWVFAHAPRQHLLARITGAGVPGRTGTQAGSASCALYRMSATGQLSAVTSDGVAVSVTAFNASSEAIVPADPPNPSYVNVSFTGRAWMLDAPPAAGEQVPFLIVRSELASDLAEDDTEAEVSESAQEIVAGQYTTGVDIDGADDLDYLNHLALSGTSGDEIIAAGKIDPVDGRWKLELLNIRPQASDGPVLVVRSQLSSDLASDDETAEVAESAQEIVAGRYTTGDDIAGATDLEYLNHANFSGKDRDKIIAAGQLNDAGDEWKLELVSIEPQAREIAHYGTAFANTARGAGGTVTIPINGTDTNVVALMQWRVKAGASIVAWPMVGNDSYDWAAAPWPITCDNVQDIFGIGFEGVDGNDLLAVFSEAGCTTGETEDCPAPSPVVTQFGTFLQMSEVWPAGSTPAGFEAQVTGANPGSYIVTGSAPGVVSEGNVWTPIFGLIWEAKIDPAYNPIADATVGGLTVPIIKTAGITLDPTLLLTDGGPVVRAYNFDGIDDHVARGERLTSGVIDKLFVSAWIDSPISGEEGICNEYTTAGEARAWAFTVSSGGTLNFWVGTGGGAGVVSAPGGTVTADTPTYVAAYFNAGDVTFYVNGVAITTVTAANSTLPDVAADFVVGSRFDTTGSPYLGKMADVRVYQGDAAADAAANILTMHNSPENYLGLALARYKMDEGEGIACIDSSGSDNHATITDATLSTFHAIGPNGLGPFDIVGTDINVDEVLTNTPYTVYGTAAFDGVSRYPITGTLLNGAIGIGGERGWWCASLDHVGNGTATAHDLANAYDATLLGMTPASDWVADTDNGGIRAWDFSTASFGRIEMPVGALASDTGSVSLWAKAADNTTEYRVFGYNDDGLFALIRLNAGANDEIEGYIRGPSAGEVVQTTAYSTTVWRHIAITFAPSDFIKLYVDGNYIGQAATTTIISITSIGRNIGSGRTPSLWLNGRMDDVRTFHRILTPAEITLLASKRGYQT